jgi:hypothetical protein
VDETSCSEAFQGAIEPGFTDHGMLTLIEGNQHELRDPFRGQVCKHSHHRFGLGAGRRLTVGAARQRLVHRQHEIGMLEVAS